MPSQTDPSASRLMKLTNPISVPADLWATSVMPEGIVERWLYPDESFVAAGDPVAVVRIEDGLHDILAPCKGRLHVGCRTNTVIEPGMVIGHVSRTI